MNKMNKKTVILLISINFNWLDKTLKILEKHQHIIFSARNGMEGLQIANHLLPDMIICEDTLSDMQGVEFGQLIDNVNKLREIPFVLGNESGQKIDEIIKCIQADRTDYQSVNNRVLPNHNYLEYSLEFSNRFYSFSPSY
jgi:CheY-like chemotaxis protein